MYHYCQFHSGNSHSGNSLMNSKQNGNLTNHQMLFKINLINHHITKNISLIINVMSTHIEQIISPMVNITKISNNTPRHPLSETPPENPSTILSFLSSINSPIRFPSLSNISTICKHPILQLICDNKVVFFRFHNTLLINYSKQKNLLLTVVLPNLQN